MPYSATSDPYLDPVTRVLKNKLGITDKAELEEAEADITSTIIASIPDHPVVGNFDLAYLQAIHKELFQPIYDWAGAIRTVELGRDETRFANSDSISAAAHTIFSELHAENLHKGLPIDRYLERLAHYYSEVNILHPFREGNGRTQRVFFTLLVDEAGYYLSWEQLGTHTNVAACIAAYNGDESQLVAMLKQLVKT